MRKSKKRTFNKKTKNFKSKNLRGSGSRKSIKCVNKNDEDIHIKIGAV